MICDYCRKDFSDIIWENGKTYKGIDRHHNPPEFISNFLNEKWNGEFYNLCRKHHRELHDEIIKILNKHSNSFKFINSEYYILQKMTPRQIQEAKEEIIIFTREWLKNGNYKTT